MEKYREQFEKETGMYYCHCIELYAEYLEQQLSERDEKIKEEMMQLSLCESRLNDVEYEKNQSQILLIKWQDKANDLETQLERATKNIQEKEKEIKRLKKQSEQVNCHHQYMNAGTLQSEAMKKCPKCGNYVKAL